MLDMSEKELLNAIEALGQGEHNMQDIEKQVLSTRTKNKKPIRKRNKRADTFK